MTNENMKWVSHISGLVSAMLFVGFVGPLVLYLIYKDTDYEVAECAKEALNFQITVALMWVVSFILAFVLIGFVLSPIVWIYSVVMPIVATVKTANGERYRYPLTIRFVS